MNKTAAIVFAGVDPKKASDFLTKYMDLAFPESAVGKEVTLEQKVKELNEFSKKEISLTPGVQGSYKLNIEEKE